MFVRLCVRLFVCRHQLAVSLLATRAARSKQTLLTVTVSTVDAGQQERSNLLLKPQALKPQAHRDDTVYNPKFTE